MSTFLSPFTEPIYVTRPLLPCLDVLTSRLQDVWKSRWLTNNGPQHQELEERLRRFLRLNHFSLFNNGTIALITAVQSLGLSGEVITTPFTFPATPHVLTWNNITPVFCDIDPVTMNIDPAGIEKSITKKTTGILAVHVFGTPCDVKAIAEIAERNNLKVIYDAAHAFLTHIDGQGIGCFGDVTMYSFHATKLFHTAEGGGLACNSRELKEKIDLLKNFGIKNEDEVVLPGINGKMNEIQAALGLVVLNLVAPERKARMRIAEVYQRSLSDCEGLVLPPRLKEEESSFQYYPIRIVEERFGQSRDSVYKELKKYNIFTRKYFFPLCSEYACYQALPSSAAKNLPQAHQVVSEILCLPFYGQLTESDAEKICAILRSLQRN